MRTQTIGEEIFNSITHGVGALAALVGLIILEILAVNRGKALQITTFSIYGAVIFLLYLFSTLYHSIQAKKAKKVLRLFDHIFIYLLIAASYTPILALLFKNNVFSSFLPTIIIWSLALTGVILKIFLIDNQKFANLDLGFYLVMGWFLMFILSDVRKIINVQNLIMLGAGGAFYSLGTIFYRWHRLKFHHAYWHMFVLCGSVMHYLAIIKIG